MRWNIVALAVLCASACGAFDAPEGSRPGPWNLPGSDDDATTGDVDETTSDDAAEPESTTSDAEEATGDDGIPGATSGDAEETADDGGGDSGSSGGAGMAPPPCPDPQMVHFPVEAPHNIGYDNASCGTGTCEVSCPDAHANSDWNGPADHHGIDIFAHYQAELVAVAAAEVVAVGVVSDTSGIRVRIRDACGWEYYYGHLDEALVQVGDTLAPGDVLGTMGATGTQSVHLHFNVSFDGQYGDDIDPFDLLDATSPTACM